MMNIFHTSTKIVSGKNCLDELNQLNNQRIWLICDEFIAKSSNLERIIQALPCSSEVKVYSDIRPDPSAREVADGVKEMVAYKPDVLIALGGGSSIDAAKAIQFFARESGIHCKRFIAIPTTCGTGSEVTSASVVSLPDLQTKVPLFDDNLLPDTAILDSHQLLSVPANILAFTAVDALTHAVEAYVATGADEFSDALAEKAVRLIFQCLPAAFVNSDHIEAKDQLQKASTMAGIAFNHAGLGLTHAVAHQLGGQFHLPHGLANALLLIPVMIFNSQNQTALSRYASLAKSVGLAHYNSTDSQAYKALMQGTDELLRLVGIPSRLNDVGITANDVERTMDSMCRAALLDATLKTTPVVPDAADIKQLLCQL